MSYPLSSDVTAGQPTAASHYNNLLADALRFGNVAADSALLGELLAAYQSGLSLSYLATNRIRVPASVVAPVRLVVGGAILTATNPVDLPAGQFTGAAATYTLFAVRSAGSTTFTLSVNTSPTESSTTRAIGSVYWDGSTLSRLQSVERVNLCNQSGLDTAFPCNGRLTLTTATPITFSVTAATSLYFTPYLGNRLALYEVGYGWRTGLFSEVSLALAALTTVCPYDIFIYQTGGVFSLEAVAWTSDTVRASALAIQDGIYVKTGDPTHRYLGTIRTSASGQCEDSIAKRFVWNYYNRVWRSIGVSDYSSSHTYSGAMRLWNNTNNNNIITWVVGLLEDYGLAWLTSCIKAGADGSTVQTGLAINSSSAGFGPRNYNNQYIWETMPYILSPVAGYNYASAYESGSNASDTFAISEIRAFFMG